MKPLSLDIVVSNKYHFTKQPWCGPSRDIATTPPPPRSRGLYSPTLKATVQNRSPTLYYNKMHTYITTSHSPPPHTHTPCPVADLGGALFPVSYFFGRSVPTPPRSAPVHPIPQKGWDPHNFAYNVIKKVVQSDQLSKEYEVV